MEFNKLGPKPSFGNFGVGHTNFRPDDSLPHGIWIEDVDLYSTDPAQSFEVEKVNGKLTLLVKGTASGGTLHLRVNHDHELRLPIRNGMTAEKVARMISYQLNNDLTVSLESGGSARVWLNGTGSKPDDHQIKVQERLEEINRRVWVDNSTVLVRQLTFIGPLEGRSYFTIDMPNYGSARESGNFIMRFVLPDGTDCDIDVPVSATEPIEKVRQRVAAALRNALPSGWQVNVRAPMWIDVLMPPGLKF